MSKQIELSVAIATFNEQENIKGCLLSVKNITDEVVIVDGKSNDKTQQIAKKLGARVIETSNRAMFHINKNLAIQNCKGKWVLLLDADERVSKELGLEIKEIIAKTEYNGFWINRKNWFLGDFLQKGGAYPDSVIRLFRNGKGILPEITVHEQIEIKGKIGHLKNDILHLADPTFSRYLQRAMRYTSETAEAIKKKNPGINAISVANYMILMPTRIFLSIYFRHKGYLDGFRGFVWALFSASHPFFSYVKYWQSYKE